MKPTRPIHRLKLEARRLSREMRIPLHMALDRIAAGEGFARWSLLAAATAGIPTAGGIFAALNPGDLLLIAARPGQGKTLLGMRLAVEAMRRSRRSAFFTLEYTEDAVRDRFLRIGADIAGSGDRFDLDTSDRISAVHMVSRLGRASAGTFVLVDYLQLLDQKRDNPPLADQVGMLHDFARTRGLIIAFLSQIDRTHDPATKPYPGLRDVRLPNPLDLGLFDKACFLGSGGASFQALA